MKVIEAVSIIISFFFVSCNIETQEIKTEKMTYETNGSVKDSISSKQMYEIVKIDSLNSEISRIFVVVDTATREQFEYSICDIISIYNLNKSSNISFFSEKMYADYKDVLFMGKNKILPKTEYNRWLNEYYLAEYNCSINKIILYPANSKKKMSIQITSCD